MLIDIERNCKVGSWLAHRLSAGRINERESILNRFNQGVTGGEVKLFFCGPGAMAKAVREATKSIQGFDIDVSSENFHDN